jgi:hypothetical protein
MTSIKSHIDLIFPSVSQLLELDSKYHIRLLFTWNMLNNCSECQKPLMSYWNNKTPSEFLICRKCFVNFVILLSLTYSFVCVNVDRKRIPRKQ